ncbi:MAG: hypothetical protein JWO68_635 [Actinomycetia bacterium]|nr:hypothetical protein [Actinomycetes bacterium]
MRASGLINAPSATSGAHLCWVFEDASFSDIATSFLAEGVARNERVVLVAEGDPDALLDLVPALPDRGRLVSRGALVVADVRGLYSAGHDLGARQVAVYAELTAAALADGFTGLRVAADATLLVAEPADRRRFLHYELAVDHFITRAPMMALCAYDASVLGPDAAELACVHPQRHVGPLGDPGFCLYHGDDGLRLEGEVDFAGHLLLERSFEAAMTAGDHDFVLDLAGLEFIDSGGVVRIHSLADALAGEGRQLTIRAAAPVLRRCWSLFGYDATTNVTWRDSVA